MSNIDLGFLYKTEVVKSQSASPISGIIRLKLERLGMTPLGIAQLAAGETISNDNDRRLVERIVAAALEQR